jgi:hypothetical protein
VSALAVAPLVSQLCADVYNHYPSMEAVLNRTLRWNAFADGPPSHWTLASKLQLVAHQVMEEVMGDQPFLALHWECAEEHPELNGDVCGSPLLSVGKGTHCFVTHRLRRTQGVVLSSLNADAQSAPGSFSTGRWLRRFATKELVKAIAHEMMARGASPSLTLLWARLEHRL